VKATPAIVALAALAAAGCGGDDDGQTERSGGISTDGWAGRVERLCKQDANTAERAVLRLSRRAQAEGMGRTEYAARVTELRADLGARSLQGLRGVPLPRDGEEARRFVRGLESALVVFAKAARAMRRGDTQAVQRLDAALMEKADSLRVQARALDVEACIPPGRG
jgi:hypothetical protein